MQWTKRKTCMMVVGEAEEYSEIDSNNGQEIYYSQFDKHKCIDFHRVNCNEPLRYSITFSVCLRFHRNLQCNCECNSFPFFMQIIN